MAEPLEATLQRRVIMRDARERHIEILFTNVGRKLMELGVGDFIVTAISISRNTA